MTKNTRIWQLISNETNYRLEEMGEANTLDEGSQQLSGGVYTTFRTFEHDKVFRLEDHFERLERSAELQGHTLTVPRFNIRAGLRDIVRNFFSNADIRLRIHCALKVDEIRIYLMAEPFTPYPEVLYREGAIVKSIDMQRGNPVSKATNFIEQTREIRKTKPAEIHEFILVAKDGTLLEGMTSNIFVIKEGKIWTADQGVLPGITRQIVIEIIAAAGIKTVFTGFPLNEITQAEEAFITSASRGVLPVVRIDEFKIGSGKPGKITLRIRTDYQRWLQNELRPI